MPKRSREEDIYENRCCDGCDRDLFRRFYSYTPKFVFDGFNFIINGDEFCDCIDYCEQCFDRDGKKIEFIASTYSLECDVCGNSYCNRKIIFECGGSFIILCNEVCASKFKTIFEFIE